MLGLILSLLYAAYLLIQGATTTATYLQTTHFLYNWYLVWTIVGAIIMLAITIGGGAAGISHSSKRGVGKIVLSAIGGGAVSLLLWIVFAIRRGMFVIGSYLLSTALIAETGQWQAARLIIGGLLIFVALITSNKSGSSSSSKHNS